MICYHSNFALSLRCPCYIWMGLEEIRWRKECGMGERQTKHTKTENIKNKKEQNTPSKAEQLQCAFRFAAIPGLQAHGVQKSMFFESLFL